MAFPSFTGSGNEGNGFLPGGINKYIPGKQNFEDLKQQLEGPKPLRVIGGLAGLALTLASLIGLLNIFKLIAHPARFVLEIYEALFGAVIALIELKTFFNSGHELRKFCYRWFPFLTVIGGKGAFYIFAGSLGLGFGWTNIILFVPAACVTVMGVIYIGFHFGHCSDLRQKYDQTIVLQGGSDTPQNFGPSPFDHNAPLYPPHQGGPSGGYQGGPSGGYQGGPSSGYNKGGPPGGYPSGDSYGQRPPYPQNQATPYQAQY